MGEYHFYFGFQYEEWEVELRLPDAYYFADGRQAKEKCRELKTALFLYPKCILILTETGYIKIMDNEPFTFTRLKEVIYNNLGHPLCAEDIQCLIDKDNPEEVVASEQYMTTEDDREELDMWIHEAYKELSKKYTPRGKLHFGLGYSECKEQKAFAFQSLYYRVEPKPENI